MHANVVLNITILLDINLWLFCWLLWHIFLYRHLCHLPLELVLIITIFFLLFIRTLILAINFFLLLLITITLNKFIYLQLTFLSSKVFFDSDIACRPLWSCCCSDSTTQRRCNFAGSGIDAGDCCRRNRRRARNCQTIGSRTQHALVVFGWLQAAHRERLDCIITTRSDSTLHLIDIVERAQPR